MRRIERVNLNEAKALTLPVTLALTLLLTPFGMALRLMLPGAAERGPGYLLGVILQEGLLWGLPALALMPWRSRNVPVKPVRAVWIAGGLLLGAAMQTGLTALNGLLGIQGANTVPVPEGPGAWGMTLLALAVIPALCEEAFFRGTLLSCLATKAGTLWAFVLTTAIFALMHGSAEGLAAHAAVSAVSTLLMLAQGRIILPILFHLGYNAAGLALPLIGLPSAAAALLIAVGAGAIWLARSVQWRAAGTGITRMEWGLAALILICEAARYVL